MARKRKLRTALLALAALYAFSWADFALAAPIDVPVDGVSKKGVPNGFLGAAHEGVDIFAARGTPVRAVVSGVVIRKEVQPRGGNVIFVLGSNAILYFYAHLDRWADVHIGSPVVPGTILGYVGDTGNAKGRSPHLHFETRVVATGFAPVDPKLLIDGAGPKKRVQSAMNEIGDPR